MSTYPRSEVEKAVEAYCDLRSRIEAGEAAWVDFADLFTEDVVYIDPAWGRIEGREALRRFLDESMRGLEDWRFPISFTAIDGDHVVVKWTQLLPGTRPDGRPYAQSGVSTLIYGGDGRFRYGEDLLNMAHVLEDLRASGWRPPPEFVAPPAAPVRDFSPPTDR